MSNETYWALKQREWAAREQRSIRRSRRLNVPLRGSQRAVAAPAAPIPAEVLEERDEDGPEFGNDAFLVESSIEVEFPEHEEPDEPKAAKPKKAKAT